MREVEQKLRELEDEQDRLRKKVKEAQQLKDPAARQAAMQNLRADQQRLLARSKQLAEELKTLQSQRAQQALEDAAAEMEDALKRLERGEEKEEDQDEILDRLAEAQEELERTRQQNEEELDRIQLEGVAKALKRLKERHEGLMAEARRIQDDVLREGQWGLKNRSLNTMGNAQKDLAEELATVGERDLKGAVVIARMIKNAADAMTQAGEKFGEMARKQPPANTLPDKETARLQELANRRLEQVLEAIQEEIDAPRSGRNQAGGQGGQGGQDGMGGQEGGGPRAPGDSIPPLAELKLLRTLEVEIRQQLVDFKKDHPDLTKLDDKDRTHYQSLIKQRQEVRELFDELTRPDDAGGMPPGGE
jgi:hypothetical protein